CRSPCRGWRGGASSPPRPLRSRPARSGNARERRSRASVLRSGGFLRELRESEARPRSTSFRERTIGPQPRLPSPRGRPRVFQRASPPTRRADATLEADASSPRVLIHPSVIAEGARDRMPDRRPTGRRKSPEESMRILVIGGTRFIGAAAVRRLQELGHEVAVLNRGLAPVEPPAGVVRIRGDRDALEAVRPRIEAFAPEAVLHNVILREEQVAGALEAIRGIAPRFVMVSSCDVYRAYGRLTGTEPGPPDPMPLVETSPLRESRYPYRDRFSDPSHPLHWYDKIPAEARALSD